MERSQGREWLLNRKQILSCLFVAGMFVASAQPALAGELCMVWEPTPPGRTTQITSPKTTTLSSLMGLLGLDSTSDSCAQARTNSKAPLEPRDGEEPSSLGWRFLSIRVE